MVLPNYQYLYDVSTIMRQIIESPNVYADPVHTFNLELIGSRFSAKTMQVLKWTIELGYVPHLNIKTDIWRYEVAGATETFDELIGALEDIYEIDATRKNSNITNRTLKLPSNKIKVSGFLSNRKNKTPKLGKARRGAKKDVQINIFEEATEFEDAKQIQMIQQATGGAIITINIFIANPWILSNWYVSKVNKKLPFNEKQLREKGEQFKWKHHTKIGVIDITHISNHRINTYLSESQHQLLYDAWNISEQFARVVDLGLPGVAEGLIYAPIMHLIGQTVRVMPTMKYKGGIDWGTATNAGGSATTLVLGRIGRDYEQLAYDDLYYHSNSTQEYKDDATLISELVRKAMEFAKENKAGIEASHTGRLEIFYDYAAALIGKALKDELSKYKERKIADLIAFKPCTKFNVPTRIDIVKVLITQGRLKINRDKCGMLIEELESAQWEDTKLVKGRPTRLNEKDHCLDAGEYMIGSDLLKFAPNNYLQMNKQLSLTSSTGNGV